MGVPASAEVRNYLKTTLSTEIISHPRNDAAASFTNVTAHVLCSSRKTGSQGEPGCSGSSSFRGLLDFSRY